MSRLGLIESHYNLKPISFMKIGSEILTESSTVRTVQDAHGTMVRGIKVVSLGLLGLFTIRQFLKDR